MVSVHDFTFTPLQWTELGLLSIATVAAVVYIVFRFHSKWNYDLVVPASLVVVVALVVGNMIAFPTGSDNALRLQALNELQRQYEMETNEARMNAERIRERVVLAKMEELKGRQKQKTT